MRRLLPVLTLSLLSCGDTPDDEVKLSSIRFPAASSVSFRTDHGYAGVVFSVTGGCDFMRRPQLPETGLDYLVFEVDGELPVDCSIDDVGEGCGYVEIGRAFPDGNDLGMQAVSGTLRLSRKDAGVLELRLSASFPRAGPVGVTCEEGGGGGGAGGGEPVSCTCERADGSTSACDTESCCEGAGGTEKLDVLFELDDCGLAPSGGDR